MARGSSSADGKTVVPKPGRPDRPADSANGLPEMLCTPMAHSDPGLRQSRHATGFGIYDATGAVVAHTEIRTAGWQNRPTAGTRPDPHATRLIGPALFAGSVDKQFGFVLLNSLGRLWATRSLPPETTLVYAAKPISRPSDYRFLPLVLRGLGLANPILVAERSLQFEELHTAPELFGECRGGTGDPAFYDWIDGRWPSGGTPSARRRVYVSRSGLGASSGRFACENHLEVLLTKAGFEIYSPERHPIRHQVETFQKAGTLVFAEGSPAHLCGLVRRPGQTVVLIQRRRIAPPVMLRQLCDRTGEPAVVVDAIAAEHWPPERGEHLSVATLDFDRLREALVAADVLGPRAVWSVPTEAAQTFSLGAGLKPGESMMTAQERGEFLRSLRRDRRA